MPPMQMPLPSDRALEAMHAIGDELALAEASLGHVAGGAA